MRLQLHDIGNRVRQHNSGPAVCKTYFILIDLACSWPLPNGLESHLQFSAMSHRLAFNTFWSTINWNVSSKRLITDRPLTWDTLLNSNRHYGVWISGFDAPIPCSLLLMITLTGSFLFWKICWTDFSKQIWAFQVDRQSWWVQISWRLIMESICQW